MADWESLRHWADTLLNFLRFGARFFGHRKDPTSTNEVKPTNEASKPEELTEIEETSQTLIRIERVELVVKAHKLRREK